MKSLFKSKFLAFPRKPYSSGPFWLALENFPRLIIPEIASVGETEESLQKKGVAYRAVKLPMAYSGRFVAENEGVNGVCKLLLGSDDTVLGAHVLGNPASEIITLAGMAIELKLTADEWKKIVFPHPTVGEIFKEAL
jgi:dihydrolipoamide dehydrogenase